MQVIYRTSDMFRNVAKSMWHRKWAIGLSLAGVAIAIATVYANCQLSWSMYAHASANLDMLNLRQVRITANEARKSKGFSETGLADLAADGRIEAATPLYEAQATVKNLRTGRSVLGVMESAAPNDPAFGASRLLKGRGLNDAPGADEVVLAESLANQLGVSAPRERVCIRLERTRNGESQVEERQLTVVGIVRGQDRAYASTETVRSLDLWVSHVTRYVGEEQNTGPREYPSALVWTQEDASKARKLAERMGVKLESVRKDTVPTLGPNSWFRPHANGKQINLPGIKMHPVYTGRMREKALVALELDDPRWKTIAKPTNDGVTKLTDASKIKKLLGNRVLDSVVGFTTPTGLVLRTHDLRGTCQHATWIATTSPKALNTLKVLNGSLIPSSLPEVTCELAFAPSMTPLKTIDTIMELPDEINVQFRANHRAPYLLTGSDNAIQRCLSTLAGRASLHTLAFRQQVHILISGTLDRRTRDTLNNLPDTTWAAVPYLQLIESGHKVLIVPETSMRKLGGGSLASGARTGRQDSQEGEFRPSSVILMDDNAWKHEAARQMVQSVLRPKELHVLVTNPETWTALRGAGADLEGLDPDSNQVFNVHRATRSDGKAMGEDVLSALKMARPTFLRVRGENTLKIPTRKGSVIHASAMKPDDLEQFSMISGRWITDKNSLVVSEADLPGLNLRKSDCIGRLVKLIWTRQGAFGREEPITVELKVVGVSHRTAVHTDLAWRVSQWVQGDVNLIDGKFQTPMEQEKAYGARRVKILVVRTQDVMDIVRNYEGQGFLVSHQIDKQVALTGLASALRKLTMVLCGATLLLSMLLVVTSVYLFYDARKGEIASLRSLGVSRRDIVKSFVIEALFFGVLSFAAGIILFTATAPVYGDLVSQAFGMTPGVLQIGIFAPGGLMLLLGSFAMALAYSLAAQALPICVAVRRSILGALRG